MSFWKKLFGKSEPPPAEPTAPAPAKSPPQPKAKQGDEDDLAQTLHRLGRLERPGGADASDALRILHGHRGRAGQASVLGAILEGLEAAKPPEDDPGAVARLDRLRVACAHLLDERGQRQRALAIVETARSIDAMMLSADLQAALGDLPRALSTIERVMARAIDAPGARERQQRWAAQLGRAPQREQVDDNVTVVAPEVTRRVSFRLLREVARGGAGTVYEAEDELLGRRLAFKVYHPSPSTRRQVEREARTAVRLRGPGILRIYDAHPQDGWLASEWAPSGSLRDVLRSHRVAEALPPSRWLPQLLSALERVHAAGLVHADLKPANVLFRAPEDPLLSDFGIAREIGEANAGGTPGYMAPERIAGAAADPRDDVYAMGRIIEDVLAARDDADLDDQQLRASEADCRRWAAVALRCLSDAAERPANATALLAELSVVQ